MTCLEDSAPGGAVCSPGNVELENVRIANSSTEGFLGSGGGLYALRAFVLKSEFIGNTTNGGAARGGAVATSQDATVDSSLIQGNSTHGGNSPGGGISISGALQMRNSIIRDNQVSTSSDSSSGGGVNAGGFVEISGSTLIGNQAGGSGGAIAVNDGIRIINSTIASNSTTQVTDPQYPWGGGALSILFADDVEISNSTITGNESAGYGGAININDISSGTTLTVESSILAGNTGQEGNYYEIINSGGEITFRLFNSVFGDTMSEVDEASDNHFQDTAPLENISDNGCHKLSGFQDNAICTPTMRPVVDSILVDAGSNPLSLKYDQRGLCHERVLEAAADIGAIEHEQDLIFCTRFGQP